MKSASRQGHSGHRSGYSLTQDVERLYIHLSSEFAHSVARETAERAYAQRSNITQRQDQNMLGDFVPYNGKRSWGYGQCLSVLNTGDAMETWSVVIPSARSQNDICVFVSDLMCLCFSFRALFAAFDASDAFAQNQAQRMRLSFPIEGADVICLRAQVSAPAVKALSVLTMRDAQFIQGALRSAEQRVIPSSEQDVVESSAASPSFMLDKKARVFKMRALGEELASKTYRDGSSLFYLRSSSMAQVQLPVYLIGLAALDECLADVMS